MAELIEVKPVDRAFYESRLRDFLPEQILDVHAHVWTGPRAGPPHGAARRTVTWPDRVAAQNPAEDLQETYRLMLPGKAVTPLIFPTVGQYEDVAARNAYVAACAARCGWPALLLARPEWPGQQLEQRVAEGRFVGVKVYLSFAPPRIPADEIRIFDFLPPHQLDVLDRRGWIVMLHVPRPGRLRDPQNTRQLLEIEQRWPGVKLIVAHVGRAYSNEDVGSAFEVLAPTERMRFDISANTNEWVFARLIEAVGPKRILFGSDMPVLRMRMRRITESGRYVNLVPKGLYGDVRGDPNLREVDGPEAESLSFFLYEELDAFRRAAETTGLSSADAKGVFYANAKQWLAEAGWDGACCARGRPHLRPMQ